MFNPQQAYASQRLDLDVAMEGSPYSVTSNLWQPWAQFNSAGSRAWQPDRQFSQGDVSPPIPRFSYDIYQAPGVYQASTPSTDLQRFLPSPPLSPSNSTDVGVEKVLEEDLPLFDIEAEGDPLIDRMTYYDFEVTKQEAFWKLRPKYKVTKNFPERLEVEKVKG